LPNLFHQNTIITVSNEDALAFILHPSATKATSQIDDFHQVKLKWIRKRVVLLLSEAINKRKAISVGFTCCQSRDGKKCPIVGKWHRDYTTPKKSSK